MIEGKKIRERNFFSLYQEDTDNASTKVKIMAKFKEAKAFQSLFFPALALAPISYSLYSSHLEIQIHQLSGCIVS
jgi:hypothetical protein